jgi:hypothetical protein
MLTLTLEGADTLLRKLEKLADTEVRQAASAGVAEATVTAHGRLIDEVSQAGTGRRYGQHVASAPGRPPAVDTGSYRASIHMDLSGLNDAIPEGVVRTNDRRGPMLEYGTRRMAPRPHFLPVAEQMRAEGVLPRAVGRHLELAVRGR